jgi:polyhydroxybutyrate depolymerase
VVPVKTQGCGTAAPAAAPATEVDPTGDVKVTVSTPSGDRWWYQHVPTGYDGTTPLPLVLDFHGYAEGAAIQRSVSQFEALGDQQHFITVSPQGQGSPVHWDTRLESNDLQFVGQVLDTVERTLCVDPHRVFVAGYSNGAFLSSTIACEYADRVAAIGPVAGLRDVPGCQPSRPVPIIAFHGTDDQFVEYKGGMGPQAAKMAAPDGSGKTLGEEPSANGAIAPGSMDQAVPDILDAWAGRNGCAPTPTDTTASSDTTEISFSCPAGAEVELYRTDGAGHEWPGSQQSAAFGAVTGKTTMTIDATKLIWAFFQQHPLA